MSRCETPVEETARAKPVPAVEEGHRSTRSDVEYLNQLLCRERSVYETYRLCIEVTDKPDLCQVLARLRAIHRGRVRVLDRMIRELGGAPCTRSEVWDSLIRILRESAGKLDDGVVVGSMERFSALSLDFYAPRLAALSSDSRDSVEREIFGQNLL